MLSDITLERRPTIAGSGVPRKPRVWSSDELKGLRRAFDVPPIPRPLTFCGFSATARLAGERTRLALVRRKTVEK
jgi:hypothetical protein